MAHPCLEEVVFDRPLHQLVADGRARHFLVVRDRFVVVAFQGREVRHLEVQLVRKPAGMAPLRVSHHTYLRPPNVRAYSRVIKGSKLTPPRCRSRTTPPRSRTPRAPASGPRSPSRTPRPDSADASLPA